MLSLVKGAHITAEQKEKFDSWGPKVDWDTSILPELPEGDGNNVVMSQVAKNQSSSKEPKVGSTATRTKDEMKKSIEEEGGDPDVLDDFEDI